MPLHIGIPCPFWTLSFDPRVLDDLKLELKNPRITLASDPRVLMEVGLTTHTPSETVHMEYAVSATHRSSVEESFDLHRGPSPAR
jgi:hypothetical protein